MMPWETNLSPERQRAILEYRNREKQIFVHVAGIGAFCAFCVFIVLWRLGLNYGYSGTVFTLLIGFCAPYGWHVLSEAIGFVTSDETDRRGHYYVPFTLLAVWTLLKVALSVAFGIPCFFFCANRALFGVGMMGD